ncbi:hypothetical protein GOP47_0000362 [Adiantum capillus-veneris]|uniref:Uncharacterized protein n=1 Tax=Adiantum capillus-veneris TaxID=13818 RepID=A0A9D4VDE3_ADICA|nr:hypothetical protein GOP47_0000362 [Adiantum capillus-veneris]
MPCCARRGAQSAEPKLSTVGVHEEEGSAGVAGKLAGALVAADTAMQAYYGHAPGLRIVAASRSVKTSWSKKETFLLPQAIVRLNLLL